MIQLVRAGLIYRNPQPHLRSRQAFFPSLVNLGAGELLCTFDIGEAVEALDCRTYCARSLDGGRTWALQGPLFEHPAERPSSSSLRTSLTPDGTLVAAGSRAYRGSPEQGLVNRENLGYARMDLILLRSRDRGRTWSPPETVEPPLVGPAFETCHHIVARGGGRWLWPTSTWRGWDGSLPNGERAVVLISDDAGRSWPRYGTSFGGDGSGLIHWEQSVLELADGRLLALAWAFDPAAGRTLPTPYSLSTDGGETFGPPRPTGLNGQTCKGLALRDGRILCLYRRESPAGLWANLSRLEGGEWVNLAELPLWGTRLQDSGMTGRCSAGEELSSLKFGYPSMLELEEGHVLAAFWCVEDCTSNIRWMSLKVDGPRGSGPPAQA